MITVVVLSIALIAIKVIQKPSRHVQASNPEAVYNNLTVEIMSEGQEELETININRMTRTVVAIACFAILCFLPHQINYFSAVKINDVSLRFSFIASALRSILNPILCICVNPEFRVLIKKAKCW